MIENPNLSLVYAEDFFWAPESRMRPRMSVLRELVQLVRHPRSLGFVLERDRINYATPRDESGFREITMLSDVFDSAANSAVNIRKQVTAKKIRGG
jgi:hypothetical protein